MKDKQRASTSGEHNQRCFARRGARFRARERERIYCGRLFATLVGAIWLSLRVAYELPWACASAPSAALVAPPFPRFSTMKGRLHHL
jgi:hypothetical protein